MTIVRPKSNKFKVNLVIIGLFLIMLALAYWSINFYNQVVDLKHALASGEQTLERLKTENAEIKNRLFLLTDYNNLKKLGGEMGLAEIKSPKYFEIDDSSWSVVSVSQF